MAKFRKKYRALTRARYRYHDAKLGGGKWGSMIMPLAGGALDGVIGTPWGIDGIGSTLVGYIGKSHTTRDIGLNRIGRSLAQKFMGGGFFGSNLPGATSSGGDLY